MMVGGTEQGWRKLLPSPAKLTNGPPLFDSHREGRRPDDGQLRLELLETLKEESNLG